MKAAGIAFDDIGDREPAFVFMPGWCATRTAFRPVYPYLERRAIALDWRGHGGSAPAAGDFGTRELVDDALAVIEAAGAQRVIPVATAHAGWVAIELRRRLGPERVLGLALIDWMVAGAPPPFLAALADLQDASRWSAVVERLATMWTTGVESPEVHAFVAQMRQHGFEMWSRAGREIAAAFATHGSPFAALSELASPTLHIYAQGGEQPTAPWFRSLKLEAHSHFPTIEVPRPVASALEGFAREIA